MNILFVNYGGFECINSAIHIFHLANRFVDQGFDCTVAVPEAVERVALLGTPQFRCITYDDARAGNFGFQDGSGPTLIHAWTPRERVRRLVVRLRRAHGCPYVVHLEDNEEEITAAYAGVPFAQLESLPAAHLSRILPSEYTHPVYYRQFLAQAAGVTAIIDRLLEFKPEGVNGEVLWPGFDPAFEALPAGDPELRYGLGIGEDEFVLVYPGNTHAANAEEMRSLYTSVGLLNTRGHKVRLIRFGTDYCDPMEGCREFVRSYCLELGFRAKQVIAGPMSLADALVQPGRPGRFNDYRFPSKLPDFLVSGRPVVLPRANIGRFLCDGQECLLLDEGDAVDIAAKLERLIADRALRERIGEGGRQFALRELNWQTIAERTACFYERVLAAPFRATRTREVTAEQPDLPSPGAPACRLARSPRWGGIDEGTLEAAIARYGGAYQVPALGYATVQDYCDSYDQLRGLATVARDLKDCQRPWAFKAVLGAVPRGGKVLEIGAGEPIVAELLSCAGYDVTVVDPYEGEGNGPTQYEYFRQQYPGIRFRRELFSKDVDLEPGTFDCIYSISVLEHVPMRQLGGVFQEIKRLLKPGGVSIHAMDHILRGADAGWHKTRLARFLALSGFSQREFDALEERLKNDLETYYLSAESHNAWRGSLPYAEFPMRNVVSLQILSKPNGEAKRLASPAESGPEATGASKGPGPSQNLYDRVRLQPLDSGLWAAATVSNGGGALKLTGWSVDPHDRAANFRISLNGDAMRFERYAVHGEMAARLGVTHCHVFEATVELPRMGDGALEFRGWFEDGEARREAGSFFWPAQKHGLPERVRRMRVHGTDEESSFDLTGCTVAEKLKRLIERRLDIPLAKCGPVLDWGCGCGRVARFLFPSLAHPYGADIDADNVDWCLENLPGRFSVISPHPPVSYPDGYFDWIYGISVFTLLAERDQLEWLGELGRLTAPGGYVLATVQGYTSWLLNGGGREQYFQWERDGILDAVGNSAPDGAGPDPSPCRSMYHTPDYVRRVWRNWFDVVDILPAWMGGDEDLVILRSRGAK